MIMHTGKLQTICYYISDYGFGHAARSLAIIRRWCGGRKDIRIIVCTSFSYAFMNGSLKSLIDAGQVLMRHVQNDIGYVLQSGSLQPDRDRLKEKYDVFVGGMSGSLQEEIQFLKESRADLVIGDIPPLPFKAAQYSSVPSVGISNFTWYTAYRDLLSEEELEPLFDCYSRMDCFFNLAGSSERPWGREKNRTFGFFPRSPESDEVRRILMQVNPLNKRKVIFFGLGMGIETGNLADYPLWKSEDCVFIVSNRTAVGGDNIYSIPGNYNESQNYIAASDLVISKPGWGTVAEAISFNKPLILVTRDHMREDQNTLDYLRTRNRCKLVEWQKLKDWRLTPRILDNLEKQREKKVPTPGRDLDSLVQELDGLLG